MYRYLVVIWYDGYKGDKGDVLGHYRTQEEAEKAGAKAAYECEGTHFNVYELVF